VRIAWLALGLLAVTPRLARAEGNCNPCTYSDSNCRTLSPSGQTGCQVCPQAYCQQTSQDGPEVYQCCGYTVPEFSSFAGPLLVLAAFLAALYVKRRRLLPARVHAQR
jgi:hypothetical protein